MRAGKGLITGSKYGRTFVTHKNPEYDLAHYESPIAQWLERPTGIWKVMGSIPVAVLENMPFHLSKLICSLKHESFQVRLHNLKSIFVLMVIELPFAFGSKRVKVYVRNNSYGNYFYLHIHFHANQTRFFMHKDKTMAYYIVLIALDELKNDNLLHECY